MNSKIAVTGGRGMLGSDLVPCLEQAGYKVLALDLPEFDLTNPGHIESQLAGAGAVINCAAFTNVDKAEEAGSSYVLALKARTAAVAYDQLKMWVDKASVLPVTIEAYAASGLLIKTLHFKDIKDFGGGIKRPATMETDSPLYKGYKSVMLYSSIRARRFPDEVFTLNYLPRAGELR